MNGVEIRAGRTRPDGRRPLPARNSSLCAAIAAFVVLLACGVTAQARSDEAARQFQVGRAAFEAQNYAVALEAFEAAVAAGQPGPAVHFNIGVTAFRLGRHDRARAAFMEVARTPEMAALAHYNLGLVALRTDEQRDAARWFSLTEKEAGDERLRGLASAQLAKLQPVDPQRNWIGYAAAEAGYDDNVALISNSEVLGVSGTQDTFAGLQLAFATAFDSPWRFDAGLMLIDYQDLDSFDQLNAQGAGRYRWDTGDWTHDIGVQLAHTLLDGEGLENKRMLTLQTSIEPRPDWRARARYRFSDIEGLNEFGGLSGHRHEVSADARWDRRPWSVGIVYRFDVSDHDDETLSAKRHQLGIDLRRSLPGGWELTFETTRRHSRYDLASNGSEDWTELAAGLKKTLSARWLLNLRYAHADNDANRAEFEYQRNLISLGVEALL